MGDRIYTYFEKSPITMEEAMFLGLLALALACPTWATWANNMNPQNYTIANPVVSKTPVSMPFHGEYFELLGPESTTRYSEVLWHTQPLDLPAEIVARFDGKVMAVTGMEVDIVRTVQGEKPTTESAPAYELYNHHYSGWMYGKQASPSHQSGSDDNPIASGAGDRAQLMSHGLPLPSWSVSRADDESGADYPNVQAFSEGNGNEHRGSYKGYAKGFAQLIKSPKTWANNPMIINTNKRLVPHDMSPGHISGLVPRHSLAPENSTYSGLLECPCTDRKIKVLDSYKTSSKICKGTKVTSAKECHLAAKTVGLAPIFNATSVVDLPTGCSTRFDVDRVGWVVGFNPSATAATVCSVGKAGENVVGSVEAVFDHALFVGLDIGPETTVLTLTGPSTQWFALALNATKMADAPYTIVVDGKGAVHERKISNHAPGEILHKQSLTIVSNTEVNGSRTVVLKRSTTGIDSDHFSFPKTDQNLPVLVAHGSTSPLSYHGTMRGSLVLTLARSDSNVCICRDPQSNRGTIDGLAFNPGVCAPPPLSMLLSTHNAICNISEYEGGLYCCHDGSILLDQAQLIPLKTDTWRLKYRFYFEEFFNNSHRNLFRVWWSTEATNNEYDVPKSSSNCLDAKTPAAECVHEIRSKFRARDMINGVHGGGGSQCMVSGDDAACGNITLIEERDGGKFQLMYAAAHCHTPACISLELWNDDTNELICRNAPVYGNGTAAQDELSYIVAIPPCLWGSAQDGLAPPPILSLDSNLTTIKRANNTNGHWGVMALWQMRAAYIGGNPPSWTMSAG